MSDTINLLSETMKSYASAAAEETAQVKVGTGRLFQLAITNVNAAPRTVYIFDNASADSGTLVIPPQTIPIGGTLNLPVWFYGRKFANGLRIHSSSSFATFTASASADFINSVSYL